MPAPDELMSSVQLSHVVQVLDIAKTQPFGAPSVYTAEAFGVVAGSIGIAAAFTACIDCFEYIQFGRYFGRDYQTSFLQLSFARNRLTRWGEAVNVYTDPKLGRPHAKSNELELVRKSLQQLLFLFSETEKISRKHKLNTKSRDILPTFSREDMDPTAQILASKLEDLTIRRQKGSNMFKLTSWALYHKSELEGLVPSITALLDGIERAFPLSNSLELARVEIKEIGSKNALELIHKTAQGIDDITCNAARESMSGHRYLNVSVKGKAHTGDAFAADWTGKAEGASHVCDGIEVDKDGKALIGNKYGGKDFWVD